MPGRANPFAPFLARRGVAIVDGALATELEARGADLRDPLWSARVLLEQPALIREVHDAYFAAGADIAITATYQATFEGLARHGLDATAVGTLMCDAVRLACNARDAHRERHRHRADRDAVQPLVAASVGPYGAFLADGSEYRGDYALGEEALVEWHQARFAVLAASGADLLACETMPCAAEVRAMLRLLDRFPTARAWITCSARDGAQLSSGEPFAAIAAEAGAHRQVVAVGINCTAPRHITSLICAARAETDVPIIVYPNSGETYVGGEQRWTGDTARVSLAAMAPEWLDAGATIIGGCCRTTPADIRALSAWAVRRSA